MSLEVYIEFATILVALISLIYIFGFIKVADHRFGGIWKLFFLAYIVFILTQLTRILDISGIAINNLYRVIGRFLFYIILLILIIKFNRDVRGILHHKFKKRK